MSNSVLAKKSGIILAFVLFSFIFLGIIFSLTSDLAVKSGSEFSYPSWLIIAYVAGLSMIILPCTLPLVFIIIPLSMGKGYKKGLSMALLFGAGLTTTITLYGLAIATIGKTTSLDQFSTIMFLIAGIAGFVFGLSQLKLITFKMPTYSKTPKFIHNRGEYVKSYLMGVLLGNAGVGCPNPMFYWLLIYIAGTGSLEIGSSLGLVHGVGRAIPLILFSLLAVLGVNATKGLATNRIKVEKITGWMLVMIGAFLIINGIPGGHDWYEGTIVHLGWNNLISMTGLPVEFHIGQHTHQNPYNFTIHNEIVPVIFSGLIIFPIVLYFINQKKMKVIL
ncbi:MAG: cytochrome C biogenesis protein [Nitrosarchaeum sp.]|nr:cytochrome C biogenesis protein [Nitrosarchaeum sp.]